ncbi:unnamed protein product [Adineta steineri]|uniref:Uncharacterized protein n=1 Tax=Adineta steineri TaxID=433720 RepID=A0A813X499_9BILA|nr:unnamed protein product [Adineta steineri]
MVNRAFRTENITLWYLFRFYLIDLCKQLELIHKEQNIQTSLILYCGQSRMSINEFNYLKSNIGSFILANGFFSSTTDIQIANSFLSGAINTEDYKVILFKIIVDIDKYVGYVGECEILLSIGSIFQIENVDFNNELNVWQIHIRAIETIRKRYGNKDNINLKICNISTIDLINKNYEKALEFSMNQLLWYKQYFPDCYLSIAKFESCTLTCWSHKIHLHITWLYLTRDGRRIGVNKIFDNMKNFLQSNQISPIVKFHFTLTYFWIQMVDLAIAKNSKDLNFKEFIEKNSHLLNENLFLDYYKKKTILDNPAAQEQMVLPDIKPLPTLVTSNNKK